MKFLWLMINEMSDNSYKKDNNKIWTMFLGTQC